MGGGALVVEAGVLVVDVGAMAVGAAAGYIAGTAAASAGQSSAAAVQWLNESTSGGGGECRNTPREFKRPRPGSGKERASRVPSWVRNDPEGRPFKGETGSDFAKRMMDKKYGSGNWKPGPTSEYNQIKKYGDRGFQ